MASLPPSVSFFMQRMTGISTSHFKIFSQSADNASAGKIVRFEIPSNSLVNFRNVRFMFNAATTTVGARLPNDISSLIERVAVYAGGVLIQNNYQGYNVLKHAKAALCGSTCDPILGHPEIPRAKSYVDGSAIAFGGFETYSGVDKQFCISDWDGFMGTVEPYILDTGLLPQITLEITLADNSVCPVVEGVLLPLGDEVGTGTGATGTFDKAGGAAAIYSLTNLSLQVEVVGMASSALDSVIEQRIASVGYLSLPFKNYFTTTSSHTNVSRFNVNSASWDRLWIAYRASTYDNKKAPHVINGHKIKGAFTSSATIAATNVSGAVTQDVGIPSYDIGGSSLLGTNSEKYISQYFRFQELTAGTVTYNLQVNGATIPAYKMNVCETLAMSQSAVPKSCKKPVMSLDQYKDSYFVQCYRFCLDDATTRMSSGLDCRSSSMLGSLETPGMTGGVHVDMFSEVTSELRCGASRSIELIQ